MYQAKAGTLGYAFHERDHEVQDTWRLTLIDELDVVAEGVETQRVWDWLSGARLHERAGLPAVPAAAGRAAQGVAG